MKVRPYIRGKIVKGLNKLAAPGKTFTIADLNA